MLPVALGAISAAGSLLGDLLDQSAAKKAQKQAIQAYKALLIPAQETARRADQYGDDVYTRTMGDLNAGAFTAAGALNPETLRTLAFTKMSTARSQVETGVKEQDFMYNKKVQEQMAQIAAQPLPTIDVTGALGAGVAGYFGGKQLEMSASLVGMQNDYLKAMKDDLGKYGMGAGNGFISPDTAKVLSPFDTPNLDITGKNRRKKNPLWMEPGMLAYGR